MVDVVADDCKEVEADKHKHKHKHKHLHSLMAVSDEESPSERKYPYKEFRIYRIQNLQKRKICIFVSLLTIHLVLFPVPLQKNKT